MARMTATETLTGALARHRLQPGDVVAAIGDNSPAIWSLVEAASSLGLGARDLQRCLVGGLCRTACSASSGRSSSWAMAVTRANRTPSHRLLGDGRSFARRGRRRDRPKRERVPSDLPGFDRGRHRVLHVRFDRRSQMRRLDAAATANSPPARSAPISGSTRASASSMRSRRPSTTGSIRACWPAASV